MYIRICVVKCNSGALHLYGAITDCLNLHFQCLIVMCYDLENNSAQKYQNIVFQLNAAQFTVCMYCIMSMLYADSYTLTFYCVNGPKIGHVVFNCANPHSCMHNDM